MEFDPVVSATGFIGLDFMINLQDELLLEETFTDAVSAAAFFDDNVLALSLATLDLTRPAVLSLHTAFTAGVGGEFATNVLFANVPEPASSILLILALSLLTVVRRRRFFC